MCTQRGVNKIEKSKCRFSLHLLTLPLQLNPQRKPVQKRNCKDVQLEKVLYSCAYSIATLQKSVECVWNFVR